MWEVTLFIYFTFNLQEINYLSLFLWRTMTLGGQRTIIFMILSFEMKTKAQHASPFNPFMRCSCHFVGLMGWVVAYNKAPSHLISGHSMLFHFISYVMSHHMTCHVSCNVILYYVIFPTMCHMWYVMSCHIVLCHVTEVISYMLQCDYITVTADSRHIINSYYLIIFIIFYLCPSRHVISCYISCPSQVSYHGMLWHMPCVMLHIMSYIMLCVTSVSDIMYEISCVTYHV